MHMQAVRKESSVSSGTYSNDQTWHDACFPDIGIHTLNKVHLSPGNRRLATIVMTHVIRNFELCGLQAQDIEWDLQGAAPYHISYFGIHLGSCKGWQSKQGWDGLLESMCSSDLSNMT